MQGMGTLVEGAARLGFDLTPRQIEQFEAYYRTLVEWNERMNLTAVIGYEEVQVRHFLDSLTVAAALPEAVREHPERPGFSIVDVGTGAGFPGVPLKILWPTAHVTLNDSIGKKTTFLRELTRVLDLEGVEVVTGRAEELGQDKAHRERYVLATARAVASLPVLCEYLLPLVKPGGVMAAPKKGDISPELEQAAKASPVLGGGPPETLAFTLPGETVERMVVLVPKVKRTPSGYPRRVGLAKSRPLGG
jgi:16S rRNA (guanine527-N7)-methyltransferase